MSHETCKKAKSGLIDLSSLVHTITNSDGETCQGTTYSDSQSKNLVSNNRITLGCSKSIKVLTATTSSSSSSSNNNNNNNNNSSSSNNNNSGSQFKYRLGKKSAPVAPAPPSQVSPSLVMGSSEKALISVAEPTTQVSELRVEVCRYEEVEQIDISSTPLPMADKRSTSIESNPQRGGSSKSKPSPGSSPSTLLSTSKPSPSLATGRTIATSHSGHQRYTSHDLNNNQHSFLIRHTSSSSTTGVTIASSRSVNSTTSTGSNNSSSSNNTRRIIFQTLYESKRKDISKNQDQQLQIVDVPQSQQSLPTPAKSPPPLPSIISQPSFPVASKSCRTMLTTRERSSANRRTIDTAAVNPSSYDDLLTASSTLSQDEKPRVEYYRQRHNDQNQEQNREHMNETDNHSTIGDDSNQNIIPLSRLDLSELEIPPYSPHPQVCLSSPSSPFASSSSLSNSEAVQSEKAHDPSPTSIITKKNTRDKNISSPYPHSIVRKKNILEILKDHIQNNPLMMSRKDSVQDDQHQEEEEEEQQQQQQQQRNTDKEYSSSGHSNNSNNNGANNNSQLGTSAIDNSDHSSIYHNKFNHQGPVEMRSIASERVLRNKSLPLAQECDKLSKTIHSISGRIDLSLPPREHIKQKQLISSLLTSNTSKIHRLEKISTSKKIHHHSETYPQYPKVDDSSYHSHSSIRKSLSDSCLYGFQDVSTLVNENDTIAKTSVANMISSSSTPLPPSTPDRKLRAQRKSSITSVDSCSSNNSINNNNVGNPISSSIRKNVRFSKQMTRHISHEEIGRNKIIRFDPRVWVHEIQCPPVDKIWYSAADMNRFKYEAILRIRKWSCKNQHKQNSRSLTMISTGTGRIVNVDNNGGLSTSSPSFSNNGVAPSDAIRANNNNRVIYTNPALSCESEDDDDDDEDSVMANLLSMRETAVQYEFKSILIVDSHDIFLKLLSKGFKLLFPHVQIATACTVEQAWKQIERMKLYRKRNGEEIYSHGFDLIVVEERLKPHVKPRSSTCEPTWNGSSLIQKIKKDIYDMATFNKYSKRYPLIIGISAYLNHDMQHLKASGSDFVWGKPPPKMDDNLRMEMLKKVMLKRNRPNVFEMFQK